MYRNTNKNQEVDSHERYDIRHYVTLFILELERLEERPITMNKPSEVSRIKDLLNISRGTTFKSPLDFRSRELYWNSQSIDFRYSNLGKNKGAIFYFLCNGCGKRVRYLYSSSLLCEPRCRRCCRIPYRQPNRKVRGLSRLIRKDYLSSEAKYMLMKRAGIDRNDIQNYLSDIDR